MNKPRKRKNRKILFALSFVSAIILIVGTYAWLSTALNVRIDFIRMSVASDSGLFISLDGTSWSDGVFISADTILDNLRSVYPNHRNRWTDNLWPASSAGLKNSNTEFFEFYAGYLTRTRERLPDNTPRRTLISELVYEEEEYLSTPFVAFDVFLRNSTGSPFNDNLYIDPFTTVAFEPGTDNATQEDMAGMLHSMRIGIVHIGWVPHKTDLGVIQNIPCNNNCQHVIYEPHSSRHSAYSISQAARHGIHIAEGVYYPTYALIAPGRGLNPYSGHNSVLDTSYFSMQKTLVDADLERPIFELPNGIHKLRVYIWVEGQDVDSLETHSKGTNIYLDIRLFKDLAGYQ